MVKINTFTTIYNSRTWPNYQDSIYKAIILEYLQTEFELETPPPISLVATAAVKPLLINITNAAPGLPAIAAAYAAIVVANNGAAPGITHPTYTGNRLLPTEAMMCLCNIIYEILTLLNETKHLITTEITNQITYPIIMSDAYNIITTIVDTEIPELLIGRYH